MNVSPKLLERLNDLEKLKTDSPEYFEFQELTSKKEFFRKVAFWITLSFLIISTLSLTVFILDKIVNTESRGCLGVIFLFVIIASIVVFSDSDYDSKISNFFFQRTDSYFKLEMLNEHFKEIDNSINNVKTEIQEESLAILKEIEIEIKKLLDENQRIYYKLKLKRKWESWCDKDLKKVIENCKLNDINLNIIRTHLNYIDSNHVDWKYYYQLKIDILSSFSQRNWLINKVNSLYGRLTKTEQKEIRSFLNEYKKTQKNKSNKDEVSGKVNLNNSSSKQSENSQEVQNVESNLEKEKTNPPNIKIKSQNSESSHNKKTKELNNSQYDTEFQPELDFEPPTIKEKELKDIPRKANKINYQRIIKPSPNFYKETSNKKIEIGEKGELLAMDFERQRLIQEGNLNNAPIHAAKEIGDGLGYDIISFEGDKKIYIEVKSTTGSFWSNLFFTENEFKVMEEFDEEYYLYRIWNLDINDNTADIIIFKGKQIILSYFNFETKVYVLTQKPDQVDL
ncbi:MAG TPA: DUF3883 domain-containing protein [Pyrinomonadaceae bacterium]|nr:DUF3883 domain-containing protein [Pyrinomonadaceae bacterium]